MLKKSAYIGHSEKEVLKMESTQFLLKFGGDFLREDSRYRFSKSEAQKLYNRTLKNLLDIIADGSERDQKYAMDLIGSLIIEKMRLH